MDPTSALASARWGGITGPALYFGHDAGTVPFVKTTAYFEAMRHRPDRAAIQEDWIERAIREPLREVVQTDGRVRRWAQIPEAGGRFLRVVLLADGETVHNAFFDRRFAP